MEDNASPNRIVVISTDQGVRKAISSTLEKAGFTILHIANGASGLERCRETMRPVHLVIVDTATPGINADSFSVDLDSISPNMPRLFLTADEGDAPRVVPSGHIREFLRKPFRRSQLLGHVLEMTEQPLVLTA